MILAIAVDEAADRAAGRVVDAGDAAGAERDRPVLRLRDVGEARAGAADGAEQERPDGDAMGKTDRQL